MNGPRRGPCKFRLRPIAIYTSINIRKIKVIVYIYTPLNQNLDEKFYIKAEIEAVKHLHAVFLLTAEQRRRPIREPCLF